MTRGPAVIAPPGGFHFEGVEKLNRCNSQALYAQLLVGLINGSFYALLSLGLAVIFGMLNIINFAHGAALHDGRVRRRIFCST